MFSREKPRVASARIISQAIIRIWCLDLVQTLTSCDYFTSYIGNSSTTNILGGVLLCCEGSSVHYKMF